MKSEINWEKVSPFDILFGGNPEVDAFFASEIAEAKATEEKLVAEIVTLFNKKNELAAKVYKDNAVNITFGDIDDERDDMPRSYTIAKINEIKRKKKLSFLASEIEKLMAELKKVSPESFEIAKMMIEG